MSDLLDDSLPSILEENLCDALGSRYLTYALSTIMHRALPDVRDGLKPVHRRLLYAMWQLGLTPDKTSKKSARVVGDVIGKYHPHGDQAVYDALVRMAQDFSARYPLIEGQGNFGNVDGDGAAAMRYTEARLTDVAMAMIEGLDEEAVDFQLNYDGEESEPAVLPAAFPNLLANGATGIAVGMATSIPPHNASEICDALIYMIDRGKADNSELMKFILGPDFPTGGVLVEPKESMLESYQSGRGGFRLRAVWEKVDLGRSQYEIVISEIPFHVQRARLVERIAELINGKKLPILADIRDESDENTRLVLEPRSRSVEAEILMERLFKLTDLEVRIPLNMNVLRPDKTPSVMSLDKVLRHFLDHRREVLLRRAKHRFGQIEKRLQLLDGYIVAYLNLDRVIEIIRYGDNPKAELKQEFSLSEEQANGILNMRLRNLRKLEEIALREERERLSAESKEIRSMMGDESSQWKRVREQIRKAKDRFGADSPEGARKTRIEAAPEITDTATEILVERKPITVICSRLGWIRAFTGDIKSVEDIKFKDGDGPRFHLNAQTTDKLLVLARGGRVYTVECSSLPRGRGMGEPLRLIIDLANDDELVAISVYRPAGKLLLASSDGRGFVAHESDLLAHKKAGKQVFNLADGSYACLMRPVEGDYLAVVGENRKMLVFPISEIPEMPRGRGVILQRYSEGRIRDAKVFNLADGLSWVMGGGRTRVESDLTNWLGKRAGAGRPVPHAFPKDGYFSKNI